jgi:hypothetical protein
MDYTVHVSNCPLVTVVETPEFLTRIDELMTDGEREQLIGYLPPIQPPATSSPARVASASFAGVWRGAANAAERG